MEFDFVENIKKIDSRYKTTFLSTVVFGILSQGMGIFNKYSYNDDIGYAFTSLGYTVSSGRWMLEFLSKIDLFLFGNSHYSLPVVSGFVSIILISFSACLLACMFDIKNTTLCICLGGIMVVFPTITGMFGYMFTLPSYMLSLLLTTLGVYLAFTNNNLLTFFGIVLLTCSIGIYQAFIPMMLGIIIIYLIKNCINESKTTKQIIMTILKSIVIISLSIFAYFVVNKIVLSISRINLSEYQGINNMGKESIYEYYSRAKYAYGRTFILDDKTKYYMYYGNIKYIYLLILFITVLYIFYYFLMVWRTNKLNSIIMLSLCLCIPLASNFIFVMVSAESVHALMVYGQIINFIFLIVLLDSCREFNIVNKYLSAIGITSLLLINIMYVRFDNQCYLYNDFVQQEAISYFTTLVTRIKSCEKYDDKLPISFVFINDNHIDDESIYNFNYLNYIKIVPYKNLYHYVNNYQRFEFMKLWCGYDPEIVDGSDLENNEEVKQMTCYPDDGSIKVVDNKVVVRFK